jgi:hypothetical protein
MALQESISILLVSKRFRPSSSRSGERCRNIPRIQAALQIAATEKLMQESGVEAVASPDRVHDFDRRRRANKTITATLRHCPFCAQLYDKEWHHCSQFANGVLDILSSGNLLCFPRVW